MSGSDIVILVRESLDARRRTALDRSLRRCPGVMSVVIPPEPSAMLHGHLVVVHHDPNEIQPANVLARVRSAGVAATLVEL